MRRTVLGLLAATAVLTATVAGAAGWLARSLAGCYVTWVPIPDRPLCGPGVWGAAWVPLVVLVACSFALALSAAMALLAMRRQFGAAARYRRQLLAAATPRVPERIERAARRAGLQDVRTIVADTPLAVTIGVWSPKVIVSTELGELLTLEELTSVLRHEDKHRRGGHPGLYGIARAASCAFPVPVMTAAAHRVVLTAEIAADNAAAEVDGIRPLVRALSKISQFDRPSHGIALGSIDGMLELRLRALKGEAPGQSVPGAGVRQSCLAVSFACLPLAIVLLAYLRAMGWL